MTTNIEQIIDWFKQELKPNEWQFRSTWISFWHKDEKIPISSVNNLSTILNSKAERSQLEGHFTDENAHAALFTDLKNNISRKIESLVFAPQQITNIWNGTQVEFKALKSAGLLIEGVIYNFEPIETVVRDSKEIVSFPLDEFDNDTTQIVTANCNFMLPDDTTDFKCRFVVYPDIECNLYVGTKDLQSIKGGLITSGDQLLSTGMSHLIQEKISLKFILC